MLARTSQLRHRASGTTVHTPLLVPSFSSKGFTPAGNKQSEVGKILATASDFLGEVYLVSAYDIHYGHIPMPSDLPVKAAITFVDSGGYEISGERDFSAVAEPRPSGDPWSRELLTGVLDAWPEELPALFVNYDDPSDRKPLDQQLRDAKRLFSRYPNQLHNFLIKPETADQHTLAKPLAAAIGLIGELAAFDVVGVTEKELGGSMIARMVQLAQLRRALNEAGLELPIHVFGALDPLSTALYFVAGAEIFDGLTWLRYGYEHGRCVYTCNYGVGTFGVHEGDQRVRARMLANNNYYLQKLAIDLRHFSSTGDFGKLGDLAIPVREASDHLMAALDGGS